MTKGLEVMLLNDIRDRLSRDISSEIFDSLENFEGEGEGVIKDYIGQIVTDHVQKLLDNGNLKTSEV